MPRLSTYGAGSLAGGLALLLAACTAGLSDLAPTIPYQHSNAIVSLGFQETQVAPDHYRIQVTGYASTPKERLEKIATTRAAEIGTENRLGYFKINAFEYATRCSQFKAGTQRQANTETRKIQHVVLTADVSYTKTPSDPSFIEARTAFPQYRTELDQAQLPPVPVDPAIAAQCS